MEIKKMTLPNLHNSELYQYACDFKGLADAAKVVENTVLSTPYGKYVTLLDALEAGFEFIRKSEHTKKIDEADALRDEVYYGFTLAIRGYCHSSNSEKAQAAESVQIVIDQFGDFREKSYKEESGAITSLLNTLNNQCRDATVLLPGVTDWMGELSIANRMVESLMDVRFDIRADASYVNVRDTRRQLEEVYKMLVALINAMILLEGAGEYEPFIKKLNERIDYYKNVISQRKGRGK